MMTRQEELNAIEAYCATHDVKTPSPRQYNKSPKAQTTTKGNAMSTEKATSSITTTPDQLLEHAELLGLDILEQSAFFKITSHEENRKALYVKKSKGVITEVHFAGFELEDDVVIPLTKDEAKAIKLGAVRGRIITKKLGVDVTNDDVHRAFSVGCQELLNENVGHKQRTKPTPAPEDEEVLELSAEDEVSDVNNVDDAQEVFEGNEAV